MQNIELFDLISARTLNALYESFPVPHHIDFIDFLPNNADVSQQVIGFYTIQYLQKSGLIEYENASDSGFVKEAVLTAKGLELLKQNHFGEKLKDSIKIAKDEAIKEIINKIFSLSLKMFG